MKIDIDKARYFAEIGGFSNDNIIVGDYVKSLLKLYHIHHTICEMMCNGGYYCGINFTTVNYDDENNPVDKMINKIEAKIIEIVKTINKEFTVKFQYYPRGYTVKIRSEKHRADVSWILFD